MPEAALWYRDGRRYTVTPEHTPPAEWWEEPALNSPGGWSKFFRLWERVAPDGTRRLYYIED